MLEAQVEKTDNQLLKEIGMYLLERAKTDPSVSRNIEKENKSLDECFAYIVGEMQKKMTMVNGVGVASGADNSKLYPLAVHYYDEDEIKIESLPSGMQAQASTNISATSPTIVPVEQKNEKRVNTHKKKNNALDGQMALF